MPEPSELICRMQIGKIQKMRADDITAFGQFSRKFHGKHKGMVQRSEETRRNFVKLLNSDKRLRKMGKGRPCTGVKMDSIGPETVHEHSK